MKKSLLQQINELNHQIDAYKDKRKVLIQSYELTLLNRVELEIVELIKANSFDIIEHQLTDWITAKRGVNCLRVWFPKSSSTTLGHCIVNVVYNDRKYTVALLINHLFANPEYNYLTFDYDQQMEKKRNELIQELTKLKQINVNDINGAYVACCKERSHDNNYKLEPLANCLQHIINFDKEVE